MSFEEGFLSHCVLLLANDQPLFLETFEKDDVCTSSLPEDDPKDVSENNIQQMMAAS